MKKLFLAGAIILVAGLVMGGCTIDRDDHEPSPFIPGDPYSYTYDFLNTEEGMLPTNITLLGNRNFILSHSDDYFIDNTPVPPPFSMSANGNVMGFVTFWNYRAVGETPGTEEGTPFRDGYIVILTLPENSRVIRIQAYADVHWAPGTPGLGGGGMGSTFAFHPGDSENDWEIFQPLAAGQYVLEWDRDGAFGFPLHRIVLRFDFEHGVSLATLNDPNHGFEFTVNYVRAR